MNKKELQEMALKQIKQDLSSNDEEAIVELLSFVPTENLLGFLSEDEQNIFKLEIASLKLFACSSSWRLLENALNLFNKCKVIFNSKSRSSFNFSGALGDT